MIDGLLQLLKEWIGWAFCWLIDMLLAFLLLVVQAILLLMPNVPLPAWYNNTPYTVAIFELKFIAWVLPVGLIFWAAVAYIAFDYVFMGIAFLYRAVMDLL